MTSLRHWCTVWMLMFCAVYSAPVIQDEQDAVDRLVERFAPLLYFHPEERWMPDDVDTFLASVRVQIGPDDIVPVINGSLPVGPHTEDHHIVAELPLGVGTPEVQHQPFLAGKQPENVPVYVTVTRCDPLSTNQVESGGTTRPSFHATYWTFHPFNEGKRAFGQLRGNHVGDWEHVSIRVQDGELTEIFVSAHEFGAYYTYSPESKTFNFSTQMSRSILFSPEYPPHLELNETHPVLYVALGSHGLWPTAGEHQYNKLASLVDITAAGGAAWRSWSRLVSLGRTPPAWLQYAGRWGNPPDCGNFVSASCQLARGPPGVAGRPANFLCGGRPDRRPWWRKLFGRRRRREAATLPVFS